MSGPRARELARVIGAIGAIAALVLVARAFAQATDRASAASPVEPHAAGAESATPPRNDPARDAAIGLVASLVGVVERCPPPPDGCGAAEPAPLSRLAWLRAGDRLELSPDSALHLVLLDGQRFELRGPLTAAVHSGRVELLTLPRRSPLAGPALRSLSPAAITDLRAIAPTERPATRLGAVRLRPGALRGLFPHGGATALAEATTLRFVPVASASRYRVVVLDALGTKVFDVETGAAELTLPPGILRPGEEYLWQVSTLDSPGATLRGEADFRTLAARAASVRAALQAAVDDRDPAALLALAEVDRRLGLYSEAWREALATAALAPDDHELQGAAAELGRAIAAAMAAAP